MKLRELTAADVIFTLECEDEIITPDFDSQEALQFVNAQIEAGNPWGWCQAVVKAKWKSLTGEDALGGCSYRNEEEFKRNGYYEDMKQNALEDLNEQIAKLAEELAELETQGV